MRERREEREESPREERRSHLKERELRVHLPTSPSSDYRRYSTGSTQWSPYPPNPKDRNPPRTHPEPAVIQSENSRVSGLKGNRSLISVCHYYCTPVLRMLHSVDAWSVCIQPGSDMCHWTTHKESRQERSKKQVKAT